MSCNNAKCIRIWHSENGLFLSAGTFKISLYRTYPNSPLMLQKLNSQKVKANSLFVANVGWGSGHAIVVTTRCEFHNDTLCAETQGGAGCNETQECEPPEPEKRTHCFVLWQNDSTGRPFIKLKVRARLSYELLPPSWVIFWTSL